jgi:ribulose-phosphate 3-epimerase
MVVTTAAANEPQSLGLFDSHGTRLGDVGTVDSIPSAIELRWSGARATYALLESAGAGGTQRRGRADETFTMPHSQRHAFINPSLLAADIGSLSAAACQVAASGAEYVHIDICDGSAICQRSLSSLGPASVAAVRKAAPSLKVDVHLYTMDPEAQIAAVASAGAHRIVFQWESLLEGSTVSRVSSVSSVSGGSSGSSGCVDERVLERARALAASIRAAGCTAGVCVAPETPASAIAFLCAEGLVELVNVLSVLPGIGGQPFRAEVLDKVRQLRVAHPSLPYIMVDGGIDARTAPMAAAAGANALVSGSFLFGAPPDRMRDRIEILERALLEHGD